jgi:hypothetical protein
MWPFYTAGELRTRSIALAERVCDVNGMLLYGLAVPAALSVGCWGITWSGPSANRYATGLVILYGVNSFTNALAGCTLHSLHYFNIIPRTTHGV